MNLNVFYLISIIIGISIQNILKKAYTNKTDRKGVCFFSVLSSMAAMLFFVVSAISTKGSLEWNMKILPYAIAFAVSYAVGAIFSIIAVSVGSLSITSLIISYSLMIPTIYGLFFLNDPVSIGLIPGIILLVISLGLINKKGENVKFSFKWIVSVSLSFLGNGMCSVTQKMQQEAFGGRYKDEFMIIALCIVVVVVGVFVLLKERKEVVYYVKNGWYYGTISGVMNGMVNLFVMILAGLMPVSLMFPLISAGGIIVTYIVSKFLYKESLTKLQFAGFIIGIGSVILLNL